MSAFSNRGGSCECPPSLQNKHLTECVHWHDPIEHPRHYTNHPSGVECIDIVEHFPFNIGAAVKYLWRCGMKGDEVEDLKKARWFIDREIQRRQRR